MRNYRILENPDEGTTSMEVVQVAIFSIATQE
jgi:hypothetical protein